MPASTDSYPQAVNRRTTAPAAADESAVIPPLPPNATNIPDAFLLRLSNLVNLTNAEEHYINKERWLQAVPAAQRLVQGPCDCEQRNWLNHFIEMGGAATKGSSDEYYKLAVLMRKLARNDQQLAQDPGWAAR